MGTNVLCPQDCLPPRLRPSPSPFQSRRKPSTGHISAGPKARPCRNREPRKNREAMPIRIADSMPPIAVAAGSDVYAGSAFSISPSPRALPLPTFSRKKADSVVTAVDVSATRDLRRLLRLE